MGERVFNHADAEQVATTLEQAASLTPGTNDGNNSKQPSHADATRISAALTELKNTRAFTPEYTFDTIAEMNAAIQAGTVKNGATIFVKEGSGGGGGDSETIFKILYGLCTKQTTIATVSGNTQITESDTDNSVTAVTTIVKTSNTVTTITTVITPQGGNYIYTKTTVITKSSSSTTIAESYTKTAKS